MNLEDIYPGYQLWNDIVELLNEVRNPTPEVVLLYEKADPCWQNIDKSPCEPLVLYFSERFPRLYKYNPILMVQFIIRKKHIDFEVLKDYLRIRYSKYKGNSSEKERTDFFGKSLYKFYIEPLVDERDKFENLDIDMARKVVDDELKK